MRRVVITGIGIVSCLGNNKTEVLDSLKQGRSGIRHNESFHFEFTLSGHQLTSSPVVLLNGMAHKYHEI